MDSSEINQTIGRAIGHFFHHKTSPLAFSGLNCIVAPNTSNAQFARIPIPYSDSVYVILALQLAPSPTFTTGVTFDHPPPRSFHSGSLQVTNGLISSSHQAILVFSPSETPMQ